MANIQSQRWLLDRRHVLRGGGAALALPMLEAMTPHRLFASTQEAEKPKRSVFIYIPNGVNGMQWQPTGSGRDFKLSRSLQPLAKHRDDFTVFSGLHHPNGLGQAHVCADSWLTAAKLDSGSADKYSNTISADQAIAEVVGKQTRYSSLELSVTAGTGRPFMSSTLAFSREGVPLPAEDSPRQVFERLFDADPGGAESQRKALRIQGHLLDNILSDARSLRGRLGATDKTKLDEYLSAVRDVEVRTERLDAWLDVPRPTIPESTSKRFRKDVQKSSTAEYWRTMFDLMALTLKTDMTRVITYMNGTEQHGLPIPSLGIAQTRHNLSHHKGDPEVLERLAQSDQFLMRELSHFLDELRSTQEEGETVLDRTMVLVGSGMSYGQSHSNGNLPILLAGGKGLGLRHAGHIDYNRPYLDHDYTLDYKEWRRLCGKPFDDRARLSNLLLTMMQKMGVHTETFVDSLGPVSELA
ncbi:DUF1552 domain-containing protein [Calycomorphotria hydatis]|uniref:DUF1552 domain-containing protein n=1 Tax=Calycomorphotria hydatis TaxID=2528027 RepID=A0A517TE89_9PLAN|nr:DUF1552 domain-containing protein [Calycomorphotria hydatis]QDT66685.1 hypothetical protein V22_39560 [Calycomorphotria hydatis]